MTSSTSWDALQSTISRFASTLEPSSTDARLIQQALFSLNTFAAGLIKFFDDGFGSGQIRLQTSNEESASYIQDLIVNNAARDLDLLLNVFLQRLPLDKRFSQMQSQMQPEGLHGHLRKTDALAHAALAPARAARLRTGYTAPAPGSPTHVLTYYNQATEIRLIPYYPLVLVGVPFSSLNWPLDLCAIPHEVGHVAYRATESAPGAGIERVKERVRTERSSRTPNYGLPPSGKPIAVDWYDDWLEEMFADVYGCVVAGPFIARHFINLSQAWRTSSLAVNTGAYPPPLVRPYVYIETLKRLQELFPALGLTDSIDTLANEWDRFVAKHNTDVQLPKSARQAPAFVSHMIQQAVLDIIPRIVPAEISSLDELASVSPWPQRTAWASGAWPSDFVAPELTAEPPAALDETAARQMIEDLLPNGATRVVPAAEWRTMLDFGGWLDKGPEGGKAH